MHCHALVCHLLLCRLALTFGWTSLGGGSRRCETRLNSSSGCWHEAHDDAGPHLALITEPDACDSQERMENTVKAVEAAISTQKVTLVSVRVAKEPNLASRVKELTERIVDLAENNCRVVVSSDWIETVSESSNNVGVHVKESHREQIPAIRQRLGSNVLIGTSAHSVESAMDAVTAYQPDYLFVGTCYLTASHPEKSDVSELEGPKLPGQVKRAILLEATTGTRAPTIFAIGGIDETNCREPVVGYGADGVAVIRAVLQAVDPTSAVLNMVERMQ